MAVADDQHDAVQAPPLEVFEHACPELLALRLADPGTEHVPVPVLSNADDDQQRLANIPGPRLDVEIGGVNVHVHDPAQRPFKELVDLLVQLLVDLRHAGGREALYAQCT